MNAPLSIVRTIRACALADVLTGELLADHAVVLDGERVAAVEPSASKHGGGDVHDLSEHVVAPGLIDMHTHLVGELDHGSYSPYLIGSAARDVPLGVRPASAAIRAGFTTVRDLRSFRAFTNCDLREALQSATSVAAERIGRSEDVGAIAPGRYADLVAVRCAHLDEIGRFTDIGAALKGGALLA